MGFCFLYSCWGIVFHGSDIILRVYGSCSRYPSVLVIFIRKYFPNYNRAFFLTFVHCYLFIADFSTWIRCTTAYQAFMWRSSETTTPKLLCMMEKSRQLRLTFRTFFPNGSMSIVILTFSLCYCSLRSSALARICVWNTYLIRRIDENILCLWWLWSGLPPSKLIET